ncbi:hypothetical protein AB0I66_21405 [Streptomyces sp. NPDC050439]|uniref:hypothetical protein n=1 Tax=unclassified Streptomyces TaxID=2593676 RepID=UPI00343EA303
MRIRADVAELLRAGLSDRAIGRELNVDATVTVRATRQALGLPPARPGRKPAATPEDLFWRRTQPVGGGHFIWTGYRTTSRSGSVPTLRHGGRVHTAYRIAFRLKHGREPEGHVTVTCDRDGCVAPGHTEDRRIRERTNTTFAAIFGGAS